MVQRWQMSTVLAVSLGLVVAVVLVQLKSNNAPNSLYEVVHQPVWEFNGRMPSARLAMNGLQRAQMFRGPHSQYANHHRTLFRLSDEQTPESQPAFPPQEAEEEEEEAAEPVVEEAPPAEEEDEVVAVPQVEEHEEPQEPDNALGDEVIDLPKFSDANDVGDMYVAGKDAEQNSYTFKQRGARTSTLYNAADPFHIGPATYDSYSGDTHGLFKGQARQALLARQGAGRGARTLARAAAAGRRRRQSLWLGEHWSVNGLQDDGNYMVPAPEEERESYANGLFDWGRADGLPVDAESGLPVGGMTQFYRAGDGDTPGQFNIQKIRENEDGGLPKAWYDTNEPASNFGSKGRGKWPAGRAPSVTVMDGHVEMIDDGMRA